MTAPFAARQARLNIAVLKHLADVEVLLNGTPVQALLNAGFDNVLIDGPGPIGSSPTIWLLAADVPARPEGLPVVITAGVGAGRYKVGTSTPDASGFTALHLLSA
jgi:hypothetical protein